MLKKKDKSKKKPSRKEYDNKKKQMKPLKLRE